MSQIPAYALYGEDRLLPDALHIEAIKDRAGPEDWSIAAHQHPHLHQLFLIEEGGVTLRIDGTPFQPTLPCLLSIPRGVVHGFTFTPGTRGYVMTVQTAALPDMFAPASDVAGILAHWGVVSVDAEMRGNVRDLAAEHAHPAKGRATMLRALVAQLLCQVARALPDPRSEAPGTRAAQILADFEQLLQQHFRARWSVTDYATALAITPTHLSRVLRDATGQPASTTIEARTFQEACRHLAYTRLDVRQIGFDLGYDDPAYFSRQFRRHVGLTPSAYRKRVNAG